VNLLCFLSERQSITFAVVLVLLDQRGSQVPRRGASPSHGQADREVADLIADLSLAVGGSEMPRTERNRRIRMSDLAATFDAHVQAEFQDLDLDATMATMSEDPYVHHVPTITGGNGTAGVRDFYAHHFIGQWPDDTQIRPISRTVGADQVVDELYMTFTHDRVLDTMLPGIEPTGRQIAVAVVVVVGFERGKVQHEHIYWDQASVLVQAGLLDPEGLPVVGSEHAEALLDQTQPKNQLFTGTV
jgi:carboxymethylenebutenolidase